MKNSSQAVTHSPVWALNVIISASLISDLNMRLSFESSLLLKINNCLPVFCFVWIVCLFVSNHRQNSTFLQIRERFACLWLTAHCKVWPTSLQKLWLCQWLHPVSSAQKSQKPSALPHDSSSSRMHCGAMVSSEWWFWSSWDQTETAS